MSADRFLQDLTQALFVVIFVIVCIKSVRQPRRANLDTALLFGATAIIIVESWIAGAFHLKVGHPLTAVLASLLMALPYLLLRLVDDFAGVSSWIMRSAGSGLLLSMVALFVWPGTTFPAPATMLLILYFVALSIFDASSFVRAARRGSGITSRRMRAVALGTLCLGLVLVVAGIEQFVPSSSRWFWGALSDVLALGCGVSYFVGFTPPGWLRRTWQEPELRAFLGRAASLPRMPDTAAIVRELEKGAAGSLGTGHAVIGLWNEADGDLQFDLAGGSGERTLADAFARQAFQVQHPIFSGDAVRNNPADAAVYRAFNVNSVLAVPITAGDRRLGVLAVYAVRAPIFAEDDLALAQLLADQAAVVLESRALIDEAARVRALEEATRLKDDFLSSAAHDLKTPLTALIAQAQLMEHRIKRNPTAPADPRSVQRIVQDARRLTHLVTELLDVGRVEQGKLISKREEVNLRDLIHKACGDLGSTRHRCQVEASIPVVGSYDPVRIRQLVDNLLENAVKYSPEGGDVRVRVWQEGSWACLTVTDDGIGIPAADLPHLFDRFHRGGNVDDRRFSGMGLGLFICRGIAEQHGGRMWATSPGPGLGSTFHVILPAGRTQPREGEAAPDGTRETRESLVAPGDRP